MIIWACKERKPIHTFKCNQRTECVTPTVDRLSDAIVVLINRMHNSCGIAIVELGAATWEYMIDLDVPEKVIDSSGRWPLKSESRERSGVVIQCLPRKLKKALEKGSLPEPKRHVEFFDMSRLELLVIPLAS
jgi:hypothetical protein